MEIGILMTGHAPEELHPEYGGYPEMFARLLDGHGFSFRTWAVVDMEFPDDPDTADGWLITGSRFGVYEDLPWIPPLKDLIRAIYAKQKPLVGICFGHQIMADALGGRAEKSDRGWGTGRQTYTTPEGEEITLNAFHQDQVTAKPPRARTIASSDFCEFAALAYRDNTVSVQAHPEFTDAFVSDLITARADILPPSHVTAALEKPHTDATTSWAISLLADALKSGDAQNHGQKSP